MNHRLRFAAGLLALLAAGTTPATTANSSFQVNASVASVCYVSGTTLSFGSNLDPVNGTVPVDATSTLSVQCTNTTGWSVALDAGTNAGGPAAFGSRAIKNGSQTLAYQLYTNAGRTTVWGDGSGGSAPVTGTGTGSTQSLTVYGRLPSLTGAIPGSYTDTVTVTITY
jgi:spore coat protein U-like protein